MSTLAGHDSAGHGRGARSVAHATELPPAGEVAARTREGTREVDEASSRLPTLAHDRSHSQLPHRHPTALPQGMLPPSCTGSAHYLFRKKFTTYNPQIITVTKYNSNRK